MVDFRINEILPIGEGENLAYRGGMNAVGNRTYRVGLNAVRLGNLAYRS